MNISKDRMIFVVAMYSNLDFTILFMAYQGRFDLPFKYYCAISMFDNIQIEIVQTCYMFTIYDDILKKAWQYCIDVLIKCKK